MEKAHINIISTIESLRDQLVDVEANAGQIAKLVSQLAGTLKIHLSNEDKYLYPSMMKSSNVDLQRKAKKFETEMGGLSADFMAFKERYNISSKVLANKDVAVKEIRTVCDKIEKRIEHEDHDLYPFAKEVM